MYSTVLYYHTVYTVLHCTQLYSDGKSKSGKVLGNLYADPWQEDPQFSHGS